LRTDILSGQLPPGAKLPVEAELAKQFNVSRITVRQALSELQDLGLVTTINGKGSYASKPGSTSTQGPLIGVLETMRKRGHRAHGKFVSCTNQPASRVVADELGLAPGVTVGVVTLMRYRDDAPFVLSTTWCSPDLAQRLSQQDLAELDVIVAFEEKLWIRIDRTDIRIEASIADQSLALPLECDPGSPILRVHATNLDYDGTPIAYSVSESRGDIMDYRAVVKR